MRAFDAARRWSQRASSESGVGIIEVLVSALLIGLIAAAVFTGFDAANRATTDQRRHSQADAVAQQDEDRMRGMQISGLANLNQTRTVTVDGTPYKVVSTGQFVTDASGSASCTTAGTSSADYIKTTSSVTWPGMAARTPVVEESILTPPAGGSLVVQVLDDQANGVSGMTVTTTDASNNTQSATTSSSGCATFGGLPAGNYNVSVAQAGFVDRDGNATPPSSQQLTSVLAESSDTMSFEFAKAGAISATFQTSVRGVLQASSADTFVAFQNKMSPPSFRVFGTASTLASNTYAATVASPTTVFPFNSPYTAYAGSCLADAPSANGQAADPSVPVPAGTVATVALRLPAMIVDVWSGTPTTPGAMVAYAPHVVLTDTGCNTKHYPASVVPSAAAGALRDPGQPYGSFTVCADSNAGAGTVRNTATVANKDPVNGTIVNVYLGQNSPGRTAGACT